MDTQILKENGHFIPGGILSQFEEYRSIVEALQKINAHNAVIIQDESKGIITLTMISGIRREIFTPLVILAGEQEECCDIPLDFLRGSDVVETIIALLHGKIDKMARTLLLSNIRTDIEEGVVSLAYKIGNYNDAIRILNTR